jgi:ribonuclease BN (tRNA processing enzyme)
LTLALASAPTALASAQSLTTTHESRTTVVILGTGNPNPDPDRSGPAVAVVVNGTAYLVDAGAGVMRRAEQAHHAGVSALAPDKIGIVFLTHLHSDHTIGLPDVIHTGWVMGREAPLKVFGPKGTRDMTLHLQEAWRLDVRIRSDGLQPHTANGWQVESRDVWEGVVYQDSNVTVTAFPVPHTNWVEALGYKFVTRDRTIVISGDTRPSDAVVDACNGCDVLVHEVYSAEKFLDQEPEWRAYHADSHTSTTALAELATRARPKLLVLYHQLYWGAADQDLLREVRKGYAGAVVSARDLGIY